MTRTSTVLQSFSANLILLFSALWHTLSGNIALFYLETLHYQIHFWNSMGALNMVEPNVVVTTFIVIIITFKESAVSSRLKNIMMEFIYIHKITLQ